MDRALGILQCSASASAELLELGINAFGSADGTHGSGDSYVLTRVTINVDT